MKKHIVETFNIEQSQLDSAVAQMGGLVEALLWQSFRALERRNPRLAAEAVKFDESVDRIQREVQERAIDIIARRQPIADDLRADDLRHAIAVLKIASDLERVGDLAKNIARRAVTISGADQPRHILLGLEHMTEIAAGQLKDVLDAWGARNLTTALSVWRGDASLDALYNSVFRDLLAWMMEDPRNIEYGTHLMFASKNLERIGDHTTNVAEQIAFLVTGSAPPRDRVKRDDTSTISHIEPAA